MAATTLAHAKCSLGAYYRRMGPRIGKRKAIKAVAHKLARLIYRVLKHGNAYVAVGQEEYERRHQENQVKRLQKAARKLGYTMIQNAAA